MVEDGYVAPKDATWVEITKNNMDVDQKKRYKLHHKAKKFIMNVITFKEFDNVMITKHIRVSLMLYALTRK